MAARKSIAIGTIFFVDALILFSHGSLLCGNGEALEAHAERLRAVDAFGWVGVGYLNYSVPTFSEAVAEAVAAGATAITVAPYFLATGYFVTKSLPPLLEQARARYPAIGFRVADALNGDSRLGDAIAASAADSRPPGRWDEALARVRRRCQHAPACPLASVCSGRAPLPTRHGPDLPLGSRVAWLVLAHGSPRPEANDDLFRVRAALVERRTLVEVGFLECNEPSIPDAIDRCVARGATGIVAIPYFLHTGTHVCQDLPALLDDGRRRHPAVGFALGEYVGLSDQVTTILAERAQARGCAAR